MGYIYRHPEWRYHRTLPPRLIKSLAEEHPDWATSPEKWTTPPDVPAQPDPPIVVEAAPLTPDVPVKRGPGRPRKQVSL